MENKTKSILVFLERSKYARIKQDCVGTE